MEITFDSIITVATLLLGGGGGAFFTWKWASKKAKAEATGAEADAARELQEVYRALINDIKADRDEQKAYINELKDDRKHLREERDELRDRIDQTDERVRDLQNQVMRNGRLVESMRPFLCSRNCPDRIPMSATGDSVAPRQSKTKKQTTK